MAVAVKTQGGTLVIGAAQVLFKTDPLLANHRGSGLDLPYDVTADSQRFIVNQRTAASPEQSPISVVVNWPALLRKQ